MRSSRSALIALSALAIFAATPFGAAYAKKGQSKWPIAMGEVTTVAADQNAFEIKDADGQAVRFKVTPTTEFEVERERPVKWSWSGSFTDLKPGSWVRVKYFGSTETKVAHEHRYLQLRPAQSVNGLGGER